MNRIIVNCFQEFLSEGAELLETALALKGQRQSGSCNERAAQEKQSEHDRPI
jgi:hypothetical protein